jgi:flagellar motor component MotA
LILAIIGLIVTVIAIIGGLLQNGVKVATISSTALLLAVFVGTLIAKLVFDWILRHRGAAPLRV